MRHETFHYTTRGELEAESKRLNAFLPLSGRTELLFQPLRIGEKEAENRIAFQPMEGTDGTEDGAPGELTIRRYHRFEYRLSE